MRSEGFFSLTAAHSKGSQFICELSCALVRDHSTDHAIADVNSRPLAPSPLHKLINDRFSRSTFSRHAASHLIAPAAASPSRQSTPPTGTKASRKSPKKSSERFPIFLLNLVAPPGMVDVTLEPEKRVVEFEVGCEPSDARILLTVPPSRTRIEHTASCRVSSTTSFDTRVLCRLLSHVPSQSAHLDLKKLHFNLQPFPLALVRRLLSLRRPRRSVSDHQSRSGTSQLDRRVCRSGRSTSRSHCSPIPT